MDQQHVTDNDMALGLLKGIEAKDPQALRKLHGFLGKRIYTFAVRFTRDVDLANQVVTDTLHDVWRFPGRFNGKSKVSTWVLAIAKHKSLHALRQRHSSHVDLEDITEIVASEIGDPESSSLDAERMTALWRCIERLPDAHRECLHLAFYEGMSLAEVAEVQKVPENTVKTRLFHARKKLHACLQGVVD